MIIVYLVVFVLPIVLILYFLSGLAKFLKSKLILRRIPCPPCHWLLGNLTADLWHKPDELFCLIRKNSREYWPIYRFEAFHMTTVNFLHPCDIEIILSSMIHMRKSGIYSMLKRWLGEGLLTSTGKKWQTRRKILTPAFHFNILQEFLKVFNEETEKLVKQIEENCKEPFIDVVPIITQMTLQSIGETAMGLGQIDKATQEKYKDSIFKIAQLILTQITRPWYRVPYVYCFSKLKKEELKTTEYLHSFAYRVIRNRENVLSKVYNDDFKNNEKVSYSRRKIVRMLDLLLMSKMGGSDIDLEGIREEVDTFMFEGHDTTSMAITYLLLLLANNQDIQATVAQEITNVVGTGTPTYDDLQELKYTERVIKEALRLYPSVPFISRVAGEDFTTYTGYFIPKGTVLNIHIYDLHRDPEVYPDPEKFDPDRFLPENCKRHPFAYIPFSAGPRNCIGQRYAILELKAVLCGILRKFFMEPVDKPSDMSFHCDMVLRPRTAVRIKFVPK